MWNVYLVVSVVCTCDAELVCLVKLLYIEYNCIYIVFIYFVIIVVFSLILLYVILGDELENCDFDAEPSYMNGTSSLPSNPTSSILPNMTNMSQPAVPTATSAHAVDEFGLPVHS